jgi:hypothetical protein
LIADAVPSPDEPDETGRTHVNHKQIDDLIRWSDAGRRIAHRRPLTNDVDEVVDMLMNHLLGPGDRRQRVPALPPCRAGDRDQAGAPAVFAGDALTADGASTGQD